MLERGDIRIDEAIKRAIEHPRQRGDGGAEREREQLHLHHRNADRGGGDFVFANRDPGPADRRVVEALDEKHGEKKHERGDEKRHLPHPHSRPGVEGGNGMETDSLVGAGGVQIADHDPEGLGEPERHDGEIIAAQAQAGQAEQIAHPAAEEEGEGRRHPPRKIGQIVLHQREEVGAESIKAGIAEHEQPGHATVMFSPSASSM